MLVKLHRPPPDIRIFRPIRLPLSSTSVLRPRFAASMAQNNPAAPAPITITSQLCSALKARHSTFLQSTIVGDWSDKGNSAAEKANNQQKSVPKNDK